MKTVITNWTDLQDYGIICLTGEACGLGMRLLCDLTPAGKETLEKFFGNTLTFTEGSNWNSSSGQVASVMLPYSSELLFSIAAFAMIHRKVATAVAICRGEARRLENPEQLEALKEYWEKGYFVRSFGQWSKEVVERNQHQMTGRVE